MTVDYKTRIIKWTVRQFLLLMIIAWMFVIFGFSAEDGETSQSFSDVITDKTISVVYPDYESMSVEKQEEIRDNTSFLVRKTGHFGEYGILGMLVASLMLTFVRVRKRFRVLLFGEAVCVVYSITDEIHQGFVEGRSPQVRDVCIDSMGALCGMIAMVVILLIINIFRKRKFELNL